MGHGSRKSKRSCQSSQNTCNNMLYVVYNSMMLLICLIFILINIFTALSDPADTAVTESFNLVYGITLTTFGFLTIFTLCVLYYFNCCNKYRCYVQQQIAAWLFMLINVILGICLIVLATADSWTVTSSLPIMTMTSISILFVHTLGCMFVCVLHLICVLNYQPVKNGIEEKNAKDEHEEDEHRLLGEETS